MFEERGPDWAPSHRLTLPTWFSHLLPEGYLRSLVAEELGVDPQREFYLLQRLGRTDLQGAVRIVPWSADEADETQLVCEDEVAVEKPTDNPLLKFSLDGLQLKFSTIKGANGKTTLPATGHAGTWIAKFPDQRADRLSVPHTEFAALRFASAAGIRAP